MPRTVRVFPDIKVIDWDALVLVLSLDKKIREKRHTQCGRPGHSPWMCQVGGKSTKGFHPSEGKRRECRASWALKVSAIVSGSWVEHARLS